VVRDVDRYREGAQVEIDILTRLYRHSKTVPYWHHCNVILMSSMEFRGHKCLNFPVYGLSLYDFLRKNHYRGFTVPTVQEMGVQLCATIAYLHNFKLIHTDLKPENILLKNSGYSNASADGRRIPDSNDIVLIDFGSATFEYDHHTSIVSTRHYRAPEVVLGCGWSYECDIWSIGCIMSELVDGDVFFSTHENMEHLALMEKALGPIPKSLVRQADRGKKYFYNYELMWPEKASSKDSVRAVEEMVPLRKTFQHLPAFCSFLEGCLTYEMEERFSAVDCLTSPFFEDVIKGKKYHMFLPPDLRDKLERQAQGKIVVEGSELDDSELDNKSISI
jgi:dual-specificity kinase